MWKEQGLLLFKTCRSSAVEAPGLGAAAVTVLERATVRDGHPFILGPDGSYDLQLNRFLRELQGWGVRSVHSVEAYARDLTLFCRFLHQRRGGRSIWEHDLDKGLRALRNGLETHLITLHTVLPLLVRRGRGLVVEVTDGDDTFNDRYRGSMFFDMIKVAITRLGRMLSEELRPHGVTSVSLTPGFLRSEEMLERFGVTEENWRDGIAKDKWFAISETPHYIGRAVVALASDPDVPRWAGMALSAGLLAKHYGFTDVDGSQPEASRFFADAYFGGDQDANVEDYR